MRDPVSALHGTTLSMTAFLTQPAQWQNNVLGAVCFSTDTVESQSVDTGVPCLRVPLQRLDAGDSICEVWCGDDQLTQGEHGAIRYRHDDGLLFGVITLSEMMFAASADKTPLQQAAESAYRQVFELLDTLRFPHLFRFWNYFSDINTHSFGLERYRQFNLGRQAAFVAHGRDGVGDLPAACALGSPQGPLSIAFLAGRVAPLSIENPRQVSAYRYPRQYGPRSPMFSRATLVSLGREARLFVSGTASIVGHATVHPGNVTAQIRETIANIKSVLAEANSKGIASPPGFDLANLNYRVYVRHPADLPQIRAELAQCVGDTFKAIYLQADVCRQELLLEIEASAACPLAPMSGGRN